MTDKILRAFLGVSIHTEATITAINDDVISLN